ncbi:MAG: hypothetical protein PHS02_02275, partial [Candidatus ainarchaeum sp.]|nr:hypothetical protein [Candidatus ainarchaeum sp.]
MLTTNGELIFKYKFSSSKCKRVKIGDEMIQTANAPKEAKTIAVLCAPWNGSGLPLRKMLRFLEVKNRKYGIQLELIPPEVAHQILRDPKRNQNTLANATPFATNAVFGCERPGKKFRDEIVYPLDRKRGRLILPTGECKGEKNMGLIAENLTSAHFARDGHDTVIQVSSRLVPSPDLPRVSGHYKLHPETGLPTGVKRDRCSTHFRRTNGPYVGSLAL